MGREDQVELRAVRPWAAPLAVLGLIALPAAAQQAAAPRVELPIKEKVLSNIQMLSPGPAGPSRWMRKSLCRRNRSGKFTDLKAT